MRIILVGIFFFSLNLLLSQDCEPDITSDSLNMEKLAQWDDNSLPSRSGVVYNDVWGYVDNATGVEYAIVGNVDTIFIFSLEDPTDPVVVDKIVGGHRSLWRDFKTYDHYLYCVADEHDEGLIIADMSFLPDSVHVVYQDNRFFNKAHNIYIDTASAHLYICGSNNGAAREGLIVLDLATNPDNPDSIVAVNFDTLVNADANYYVHDLFVKNDTAYCSHGNLGYFIWDFTDPDSIYEIANYDNTSGNPGYNHSNWITEDGQKAVFACEVPREIPIYILDISEIYTEEEPSLYVDTTFNDPLEAPCDMDHTPHNPYIKNDTLYISYYEDGVQVYDMTNRDSIHRIAYYDTEPINTTYNGTTRNWGVYPFLPSGNIIATDTKNGLFVLQVGDGTSLDVDYMYISASKNDSRSIRLTWATQSEVINEGFRVQRSLDGRNFEDIAFVEGHGTSSIKNEYELTDYEANEGINYYRLIQRDFNGHEHVSKIVNAKLESDSNFNIYPNPSYDKTIFAQSDQLNNGIIEIFNILGNKVFAYRINDSDKRTNIEIQLADNLPVGQYVVRVTKANGLIETQTVILK